MKALIRRDFQTSRCIELKARTKEKQWTVSLYDIADWPRIEAVATDIADWSRIEAVAAFRLWPRIEAVAEFRLRTDGLPGKTPSKIGSIHWPHKLGLYTQPTCPPCNEEMEKTHLIRCLAINPHALYVTYRRKSGEAPSQIRRGNGEVPPVYVTYRRKRRRPTLCNLHGGMEKAHLIRCPARDTVKQEDS
ncbi:unnamed protein product [Rodentolepis nana]|uniref:Zf-RVT domain-containing protein n=1 Tax=Rodentolepis nana TaxID=102285 RepID=A0A0R3TT70_RODNA|nr:unnamed protein product [Rodentolepis nana]